MYVYVFFLLFSLQRRHIGNDYVNIIFAAGGRALEHSQLVGQHNLTSITVYPKRLGLFKSWEREREREISIGLWICTKLNCVFFVLVDVQLKWNKNCLACWRLVSLATLWSCQRFGIWGFEYFFWCKYFFFILSSFENLISIVVSVVDSWLWFAYFFVIQ